MFSFGDEDASAAGITTKLIDILLAPYNLAVNFLMGLFGFNPKDFGQEGESFSIGKLVVDAIKSIYEWFKGLLDIDVKSIVKSIPGGDFLLGLFEDDTLAEQIADKEAEVAKIQKDVDSDGIFETRANREKNERELLEAQRELEELRAQQRNAGGTTIVNNYNSTASSNSTTVTTQSLQDAAVATGSTMN